MCFAALLGWSAAWGAVSGGLLERSEDPVWVRPPDPRDPLLEHRTFPSRVLGKEVGFQICLPPDYASDPARRYPVVYWLHDLDGHEGRSGLPAALVREAIRDRILPPLIVVCPTAGGASWFLDTADGRIPAETLFVDELIPHVDRTLRTEPGRGGRIVLGAGSGGTAAVRLALARPEHFCAAAAMEGDFRTAREFAAEARYGDAFLRVFGGDPHRFAAQAPERWAGTNATRLAGRTGILLVTGGNWRLRGATDQLRRRLIETGVSGKGLKVGGETTPTVVRQALLPALEFAVGWLGRARSTDAGGPWVNPPAAELPRVRHHVCYSALLDRPVGYSLFLPEPAREGGPMSVLYHLHGRMEDESRALEVMGNLDAMIRLGDLPPTAWVWAYGGRSGWFVDSADGRVPAERVFLEEVLPHVEARWSLGGAPERRGIDGWGMGAWGALRFAAVEPPRFSRVLLHNPTVPDAAAMQERYLDGWMAVFGGDAAFFDRVEPLGMLVRRTTAGTGRARARFRVVVGAAAWARADARRIRDALGTAGYHVEVEEVPGVGIEGPALWPRSGWRDLRFLGGVVNAVVGPPGEVAK